MRAFNVIMGDWKVKQGQGVAICYDARHSYNVDEMLEALEGARRWYGEWFAPYPWKELRLSEFPGLAVYAQGPPTNISFSENIGFLTRSAPKANASFWITAHEAAHQWWPCMAMPGKGPGSDVLSEGLAHFSTILLTEQVKGEEQRMAFCKEIENRYADARQRETERPLVKIDGSLKGDNTVIYDRGGWVFWMLHRLMGREASLAAHREYLETYRDSQDHPLIEEYLAIMRRHAPDPAAFDAYVKEWFFGTVVPQYLIEESDVVKAKNGWEVRAKVRNTGSGVAAIEIAATRGERFPKKRTKENEWRESRAIVTLGAGEAASVTIGCGFEPKKVAEFRDSARNRYPSVGFTGLFVRTRAAARLRTANGSGCVIGAIGFGIAETRCGYATGPRAGSAAGPPNTCHRVLPPIGASYSADISIADTK